MVKNRTQRVLLSSFYFFPENKIHYSDIDDISLCMDRSITTIKKNISILKKDRYLKKVKIQYDFQLILTDKGINCLGEIIDSFENLFFTPSRHFIQNSIKLIDVVNLVKGPFLKIFLIDKFFKQHKFDLIDALGTFGLVDDETTVFNLIEKGKIFKDSNGIPNLARSLMNSSLYSYGIEDIKKLGKWDEGSYEGLLLKGELLIQRGQFQDAYNLYKAILSLSGIPQDIWFICNVGKIKALEGLNSDSEIEILLKKIRSSITNKIGLAYLKQVEADILSTKGEFKQSKDLFESSIKTFQHYHYPQFLAVAYNNFGVLFFNLESYEEAEKMWIIAKRYAIESDNSYLIALANGNMATLFGWRRNYSKSDRLLDESEEIFIEQNNLEKLSGVEYIRSLILLHKGDINRSFRIFKKSLDNTFPLLSKKKRQERINVYSREVEKHKYTLIQNGRKIDLVYNG